MDKFFEFITKLENNHNTDLLYIILEGYYNIYGNTTSQVPYQSATGRSDMITEEVERKNVGSKKDNISLGKYMALILRHNPEKAGIVLDKNGYAKVNELLSHLKIPMEQLEEIVETNNKRRYAFNDNKTLIRASQGHSIDIDLGYESKIPPRILFHGTSTNKLDLLMREGLKKMNRQHVHLSRDKDTATNVGQRHGKPVILIVDTEKMVEDGHKFYLSDNNVWLTDNVPRQYLTISF